MSLAMIVLAAVMGASGVILAAAAAHTAPGAGLDSAAYMLLFHAVAVLGGIALLQQALLTRPLMLGVLGAWVLGSVLFAGDIVLRAFLGYRLFSMAAPTGGIILILAWDRTRSNSRFDFGAELVEGPLGRRHVRSRWKPT